MCPQGESLYFVINYNFMWFASSHQEDYTSLPGNPGYRSNPNVSVRRMQLYTLLWTPHMLPQCNSSWLNTDVRLRLVIKDWSLIAFCFTACERRCCGSLDIAPYRSVGLFICHQLLYSLCYQSCSYQTEMAATMQKNMNVIKLPHYQAETTIFVSWSPETG